MRRSEREPHDYEPGEVEDRGSADPLCAVCGRPKRGTELHR